MKDVPGIWGILNEFDTTSSVQILECTTPSLYNDLNVQILEYTTTNPPLFSIKGPTRAKSTRILYIQVFVDRSVCIYEIINPSAVNPMFCISEQL